MTTPKIVTQIKILVFCIVDYEPNDCVHIFIGGAQFENMSETDLEEFFNKALSSKSSAM